MSVTTNKRCITSQKSKDLMLYILTYTKCVYAVHTYKRTYIQYAHAVYNYIQTMRTCCA